MQQAQGSPAPEMQKADLIKQVQKMDEQALEKIPSVVDADEKVSQHLRVEKIDANRDEAIDQQSQAEHKSIPKEEEEKLHEEIDSLYYGDGYSEYTRTSHAQSYKTSASYISKLEKELRHEKEAREKLERELEEIKRISSEISSHLGLNKK